MLHNARRYPITPGHWRGVRQKVQQFLRYDRGGATAVKELRETTWALRPPPRPWRVLSLLLMAGRVQGAGSRALDLLRALPRVSLANLKPNPGSRKPVTSWWRCGESLGDGTMEAAIPSPSFSGALFSKRVLG